MLDRRDPRAAGLTERLRTKLEELPGQGGSPLYAHVLARAAEDVEAAGPVLEILRPFAAEPRGSALALRFLAAVHRIVLEGGAPQLARHFPSAGGDAGPDGAWPAFRAVLEERPDDVRASIARPCQTNDVGRCAALLPGLLEIARELGPRLRILELGASAGLNLNWDRFRYAFEDWSWGPEDSAVRISGAAGRPPALGAPVRVVARRGCDAAPLDPADEDTRLRLRASIWPEHLERLARLDGALDVAGAHPPAVDRADLCDWLEERLAQPALGVATVVYHSIVWQYLDQARRDRLRELIAAAGARASAEAPVAWLRMEPAGGRAAVTLTTWPGGHERIVARAGYHGPPVVIEV
ncbi:MAG TPA: DUF2332 domain-containing protein [Solirubrobacteraceae bacterium]|nr:DUF2332 domain-containing protein [Solirubrobacteraceae bacterium]